jgi:phage antirepressor YoqD-like protein
MDRLDKLSTKALIRLWIETENRKQLLYFKSLNPKGGHYTQEQKEYAVEKATTIGVRATSRLLHMPRRTIQRWLRSEGITVKRCPDWVYD